MSRHPTVIRAALDTAHAMWAQHRGDDPADELARDILRRRFDRLLDELNDARREAPR